MAKAATTGARRSLKSRGTLTALKPVPRIARTGDLLITKPAGDETVKHQDDLSDTKHGEEE